MDYNNQFTAVGFQGTATANGTAKIFRDGYITVGGVNSDTVNMPFGTVVSALPASPSQFKIGAPASTVIRGVVLFNSAFAQNDPAKSSYYLPTQLLSAMIKGTMNITGWTKTAAGSIDPVVGAVVIFNNTTGIIEFMASGASAPTGWTILPADVFDVGNNLNTGTGILNSGVGVSLSVRVLA